MSAESTQTPPSEQPHMASQAELQAALAKLKPAGLTTLSSAESDAFFYISALAYQMVKARAIAPSAVEAANTLEIQKWMSTLNSATVVRAMSHWLFWNFNVPDLGQFGAALQSAVTRRTADRAWGKVEPADRTANTEASHAGKLSMPISLAVRLEQPLPHSKITQIERDEHHEAVRTVETYVPLQPTARQ